MPEPRFIATRGKRDSPTIYDNEERRPVAVFLRDYQGEDVIPEAADAAAMRRCQICAQALSHAHERAVQSRQARG